jgi:hypothetical protein
VQTATPRAVRPEPAAKTEYYAKNERSAVKIGCIPLLLLNNLNQDKNIGKP